MLQFLKDEGGQFSSMRLCVVFVVFFSSVVWAIACICEHKFVDPTTLALLHGATYAGKVGQSVTENKP